MATVNIPTTFYDQTIVTARMAEVPDANFIDGMNAGSCQCGVGVATGTKNPKASDWSRPEVDANGYPATGQYIGVDSGSNAFVSLWSNATGTIANTWFAIATQAAADGANYNPTAASGNGLLNRTGSPVVIGDYLWGEVA